jgi:transposase
MEFINIKKAKFVLDRGFYSKDNVNSMYKSNYKFIISGRNNISLIKDYIEKVRQDIGSVSNYEVEYEIYCLTKKHKWKYPCKTKNDMETSKNKLMYVHVYYDAIKAEQEKKKFAGKLTIAKQAFVDGSCSDSQRELCNKFFITDRKKLVPNQEIINNHVKNFGFFVLLSNHISDAKIVLSIYRNKDIIEKTFYNLKNRLDMKRSKVSSEESLEGKIFVQFIALMYIAYIHQVMLKYQLYKKYSIPLLFDEIDIIEIFQYQNKKTHFSEITKKQLHILECFNTTI